MPFSTRLRNPCLLPAESSILSSVPTRSSSSIKSILRRHCFKKNSSVVQDQQQSSTRKFCRIKKSNIIRDVKSNGKSYSKSKTSDNYDMTILHEDELENNHLATVYRRKKKIPSWANKEQLQFAIINQVYFHDQNPEDIFGTICIENVYDIINSIDIKNKESMSIVVSRHVV